MKKSVRKDSIYSKLNTIVVDMRRSFSENKFVFHEDNKNHIYTNFTKETLLQDVSFYSKYFNNETVFVLGGSSLYSMFLPFYDVFFLTIEENIYFEKGISLFPNCKTLQDAERILSDNGLFFDNMKILAINTKVYEFRRNKVIS
jgi:dihydrofolate reductase